MVVGGGGVRGLSLILSSIPSTAMTLPTGDATSTSGIASLPSFQSLCGSPPQSHIASYCFVSFSRIDY